MAEFPPLIEEDAELRSNVAALGLGVVRELHDVLTWPETDRDALLRSLVGRPEAEPLAQLLALAETDNVARPRLLRAVRDVLRR